MIPKKLHFTYKDKPLPKRFQNNLKSWELFCPDWSLHFYTDEDVQIFFKAHFPEYVEELIKIPFGAMFADMFRYAVIYIYGGLYSDVDTIPLKPIPPHWLKYEAVIGYEYQPSVFPYMVRPTWKEREFFCQWTFLAKPGHLLFKRALELSFERLRDVEYNVPNARAVLEISGPLLLTDVINAYEEKTNILFLDADYFGCRANVNFPHTERSVIHHQCNGLKGWQLEAKFPNLLHRENR